MAVFRAVVFQSPDCQSVLSPLLLAHQVVGVVLGASGWPLNVEHLQKAAISLL